MPAAITRNLVANYCGQNNQRQIGASKWRRSAWLAAASAALMFLSLAAAPPTSAQTLTVIYTFHGTDGLDPLGNLILDDSGNIYGTTKEGGSAYGYNPLTGMNWGGGTVFRIDAAGNETVLFSFPGGSWDPLHGLLAGGYPNAGVVRDAAGNLYGTTTAVGGFTPCVGPRGNYVGCGTLFKIDPAGHETALHAFNAWTDGAYPSAVVMDTLGNLYGTTSIGGGASLGSLWYECMRSEYGCGTVFKIDAAGNATVLHAFIGWGTPNAGVVLDAAGNLYGTTAAGGGVLGWGTVFKIDPAGNETTLHSFNGADGGSPQGVVGDASGNLYGIGWVGGSQCVFKIDAGGNFGVVHVFNVGEHPSAGLVLDASGNLYGSANLPGGPPYNWFLFRIDPAGNFIGFRSFEGEAPSALSLDSSGNLYFADGAVFKITLPGPFSSFSAKLDIAAGGFQFQAFFTQGKGAAVIDPAAQGMALALGTYTVTIPPGVFHQTKKGWFVYEGMIDGVALQIRVSQKAANSWEVQAEGSGPNFTSLTKPATVTLTLGNNSGTTVVTE